MTEPENSRPPAVTKGASVSISSPQTGDTIPASGGVVVGLYDTGGGTFDKVECQFRTPGTATQVGASFYGQAVAGNPGVWRAETSGSPTGTYDLAALLHLTAGSGAVADATMPGVLVSAAPSVSINLPSAGDPNLPSQQVDIVVKLAPGHPFTTLTAQLVAADGGVKFEKVQALVSGQTQVQLSGAAPPGNHYHLRVKVAGGGQNAKASAGGLKLT